MRKIKISPQILKGEVEIPPSKSMSHRAIIAASLSSGETKINPIILSDDIQATCRAMENLGAIITYSPKSNGMYELLIKGNGHLLVKSNAIECLESGSTLRFLVPFAALVDEPITFTGKGRLGERPLNAYYEIFKAQGVEYQSSDKNALPLTVYGKMKSGHFKVNGSVSSQFITGLLMALPLLEGDSFIEIDGELQSVGYVQMTINLLKTFGIKIDCLEKGYAVKGKQQYISPASYQVEGDFSQAAFWLVAGCLGHSVTCKGLSLDVSQGDRAIVSLLKSMGASIEVAESEISSCKSSLKGIRLDGSQIPDIIPILCVAASCSQGKTEVFRASRLRIKESDRILSTVTELKKLGVDIEERPDGMLVNGPAKLKGSEVSSWGDHRIAMSLAIASIVTDGEIILENPDVVSKSYPHFWDDFKKLGGIFNEY